MSRRYVDLSPCAVPKNSFYIRDYLADCIGSELFINDFVRFCFRDSPVDVVIASVHARHGDKLVRWKKRKQTANIGLGMLACGK